MTVPEIPAGWELTAQGRPHKSIKAARATVTWLSAQKNMQHLEFAAVTLSDGTHRIIRRSREVAAGAEAVSW